jgi:hypothetical protein
LVWVTGCAQILGLPTEQESKQIGDGFCKCDDGYTEGWAGEKCSAHISDALDTATREQRDAWLELFEKESCHKCTNTEGRRTCASAPPVCVPEGGACGVGEVCCAKEGLLPYCSQGACAYDPVGCLPVDTECTTDGSGPPCCGAAAFLAACVPSAVPGVAPTCAAGVCNIQDPSCPGCCARVGYLEPGMQTLTEVGRCVEDPEDCAVLCNYGGPDGCIFPNQCVTLPAGRDMDDPNIINLTVDVCLAPCGTGALPGDTCGEGACCVRFIDLPTDLDQVLCLPLEGAAECAEYGFCTTDGPSSCFLLNECLRQPIPNPGGDPVIAIEQCGVPDVN